MTEITQSELKIIFFAITFMSVLGIFWWLYSDNPVSEYRQYTVSPEEGSESSTSSGQSSWISSILGFSDEQVAAWGDITIVTAIFLAPVLAMLLPIAIRFAKDLLTQWV